MTNALRSIRLLLVASMLTAILGSEGARSEPQARSDLRLSYADRTEILDLFSKYGQYLDAHQAEAFAAIFTSDGELTFPGVDAKGHDQLVAFATRPDTDRLSLHFVGDTLLVQTSPGHVRARSTLLTASEDAKVKYSATGFAFGTYLDDIVKTPKGWRIARREADSRLPLPPEFLP